MSQFKKSEDMEIYEMDYSTNVHLQEVCDIRQPVLFNVQDIIPGLFSDITAPNIAKFGSYDVKLKDAQDYYSESIDEQIPVDSITLPLHTIFNILENDKTGRYFSENNDDFLEETNLIKRVNDIDYALKPSFTIHSKRDILYGSCNTVTPLKYHTDFRQFLCVTSGKVRVKMTPWKSTKYLHPYKDYEHYEFRSPVHPTKPSEQYMYDYEKVIFLDFEVNAGIMLYVPPYWWYSIIYMDDPSTFIYKTTYNTLMNCASNLPDLAIYVLQQQNIVHKVKKIPIISADISNDPIVTESDIQVEDQHIETVNENDEHIIEDKSVPLENVVSSSILNEFKQTHSV
jgi:hypothetical protein